MGEACHGKPRPKVWELLSLTPGFGSVKGWPGDPCPPFTDKKLSLREWEPLAFVVAWGAVGHQEGIWPPTCSSPHITEVLSAGCWSRGQNMQGLGPLQMMASEDTGQGSLASLAGILGGWHGEAGLEEVRGHCQGRLVWMGVPGPSRGHPFSMGTRGAAAQQGWVVSFSAMGPTDTSQAHGWTRWRQVRADGAAAPGPLWPGCGSYLMGKAALQLSEPVPRPQNGPDTYLLGVWRMKVVSAQDLDGSLWGLHTCSRCLLPGTGKALAPSVMLWAPQAHLWPAEFIACWEPFRQPAGSSLLPASGGLDIYRGCQGQEAGWGPRVVHWEEGQKRRVWWWWWGFICFC